MENSKHKSMTLEDFTELLKYVQENHSFNKRGLRIKYVTPIYDTRTGDIFSITFRGMHSEAVFSLVNEDYNKDLKEWIYTWLKSGE